MQRREMDRRQEPGRQAERDASQPMDNQPRSDDEADEQPESVPNFLTARELQAREPQDGERPVGERRVLKERRRSPGS